MLASAVKVLLIEDSLAEARFLQEILRQANLRHFHLVHVKRLRDALAELSQGIASSRPYDVVLLDLTLPDSQGLASLPPLLKQAPNLPIVVLTNTNDDELAIEAVRQVGSRVQFNLTARSEIVIFQIQDWGIGIPKADLQQLFQPFHRAGNVGSIPGTGLGLAIAKKCIEACSDEIFVESEVGVGTTFTVTLPAIAATYE